MLDFPRQDTAAVQAMFCLGMKFGLVKEEGGVKKRNRSVWVRNSLKLLLKVFESSWWRIILIVNALDCESNGLDL